MRWKPPEVSRVMVTRRRCRADPVPLSDWNAHPSGVALPVMVSTAPPARKPWYRYVESLGR
jgi:hypothetical protein